MHLGVSGHRPNKLSQYGYQSYVIDVLDDFATEQLSILKPECVYTGMAQGWDQSIATACIRLSIPFVAVIPYAHFGENWPNDSYDMYVDMLRQAKRCIVVSKGEAYHPYLFQLRNIHLIDQLIGEDDRLLVLWNGTKGGTKNAIDYAVYKPVQLINCWNEWVVFRDKYIQTRSEL